MSFLDNLEEIESVEMLAINCNDGIRIEVTHITPQIAKDYIKYQTIDETGWVRELEDKGKLDFAKWFINRGCDIEFSLNKEINLSWIEKWLIKRKIKNLNKLIGK